MSSAKRGTCDDSSSRRSFMYMRNRIGPKTDPWGTPEVTGISPHLQELRSVTSYQERLGSSSSDPIPMELPEEL